MFSYIFIHSLDFVNLIGFIIRRTKIGRLFFLNNNVSSILTSFFLRRVSFTQINFGNSPHSYFKKEKYKYIIADRLFNGSRFISAVTSILKPLNLPSEKLITSLKKDLISRLEMDAQIIALSDEICKEKKSKYVVVTEYGILGDTIGKDKKLLKKILLQYLIKQYLIIFYKVFSCLRLLLRKEQSFHELEGIKYVFEQLYSYRYGENPEFEAFYNYFKNRDDILYICTSKDSEIYKTLKDEGKHVIARNQIYISKDVKWKQFKLLCIFCLRTIFSSRLKSPILKISLLNVFYHQLYFRALFRTFKPLYYLKVRSDMGAYSPIVTAIAEKCNVKHIGYMCGAYNFFNSQLAHIDFHHYGLFGRWFQSELFKNYWPKETETHYHILGPITVETGECCYAVEKKKQIFTISLFTTTTSNDIWMNDDFYDFFIEEACSALSESDLRDYQVLFKEKYFDKRRRDIINATCYKYKLVGQIVYHSSIPGYLVRRPIEVIEDSDIVIVMGSTTTAFEALGKMKKMIIVEQEWLSHPFEKYLKKIVVKNREQLRTSLSWLVDISQERYEEKIQELIENCSKVADGNLAKYFFEAIEKVDKQENVRP